MKTKMYEALFDYQKAGVEWLWALHLQKVGGVVGDDMGLGKTHQVRNLRSTSKIHFRGDCIFGSFGDDEML